MREFAGVVRGLNEGRGDCATLLGWSGRDGMSSRISCSSVKSD